MIRTYSQLMSLPTYEERLKYLQLNGKIGVETFGFDRYVNQKFYRSSEWRQIKPHIIARDGGCDLALPDRVIDGKIFVHHMNPICIDDIRNMTDYLLNSEYLICVSKYTHDLIHYGYGIEDIFSYAERSPNDTSPWRI